MEKYFVLLYLLLSSCNFNTTDMDKVPVARVFNNYLYLSDLEGLVGDKVSKSDSVDLTNYHINNWIRQQLLLQKASENLPAFNPEIEKQVKNYRESLLIFLYEQELIKNNADSLVLENEIQKYYADNLKDFELKESVVKATYIVLPTESPNLDTFAVEFKNINPENLSFLKEYCLKFALSYAITAEWFLIEDFKNQVPLNWDKEPAFYTNSGNYKREENGLVYLINIDSYTEKGATASLDYERKNIAKIIVNKRKSYYIKSMKDKIYNEAINKNEFEIYDIKNIAPVDTISP